MLLGTVLSCLVECHIVGPEVLTTQKIESFIEALLKVAIAKGLSYYTFFFFPRFMTV